MNDLPLQGFRVTEFCSFVAGPVVGRNLALLGAEVIKVERPGGGDDGRHMSPKFDGEGLFFTESNAGKKSIVLDLKTPSGLEVARQLIAASDVVIENMRPGAMAAVGLDPEALQREHPHLVVGSINGFGEGHLSDQPSYDPIIQAAVGFLYQQNGTPDMPPVRVGASVVDKAAGLWLTVQLLGQLMARTSTGRGGYVTTSLLSAGVHLMGAEILRFLDTGRDFFDQPRDPSMGSPGVYKTGDGRWIQISPANDRLYASMCEVLGAPELTADPRFATQAARSVNRTIEQQVVAPLFAQRPCAEWVKLLRAAKVPCHEINHLSEFVADVNLSAPYLQRATRSGGGSVPLIGSPLDDLGGRDEQLRLPRLGEDTAAVLERVLGLDQARIEELAGGGAFGPVGVGGLRSHDQVPSR